MNNLCRSVFIAFISLWYLPYSFAQNIVRNYSFENIRKIEAKERFFINSSLSYNLPDWEVVGGTVVVCTSDYTGTKVKSSSTDCGKGKVGIADGDVMIELRYVPNCWSPGQVKRGCADYVGQKLDGPLKIGKIYKLSASLYIPSPDNPSFAKAVGFALYPENPGIKANRLLEGSEFLIDTVIFNKWYKASWLFRPTCELNYLALGVFAGENPLPVHGNEEDYNHFFLDHITLELDSDESAQVVTVCRAEKVAKTEVKVAGATVFFDSGSNEINDTSAMVLDSLAERIRSNPGSVYKIFGHTDMSGTNHEQLAKARISSTLDYLKQRHKITSLKFLSVPVGSSRPLSELVDSPLNRRVEVVHVGYNNAEMVYRNLLTAIRNKDTTESNRLLNIWVHIADEKALPLVLYDPRAHPILDRPGMREIIIDKVNRTYVRKHNRKERKFLDSLWREDQLPRTLGRYIENISFYDYPRDTSDNFWRVDYPYLTVDSIVVRNTRHLGVVQKWLSSHDWPKFTEVGAKASVAIPLVLIHSGDVNEMEKWLPTFHENCRKGEGSWRYYAMLYDRSKVLQGLPQRYGTQFKQGEQLPLENADSLSVWRRQIGLQ